MIDVLNKKDSRYKILSNRKQDDYYYWFAKLVDTETVLIGLNSLYISDLGVHIDIFPMDYLPNNEFYRNKIKRKITFYCSRSRKTAWIHNQSKVFYRKCYNTLALPIERVIGHKYFNKKLEGIQKTLNREKTEQVEYWFEKGVKRNLKASWFNSTKMMLFEGQEFPVPAEYDKLLREIYGDFMKLPPEKERITHHNFKAFRIKL